MDKNFLYSRYNNRIFLCITMVPSVSKYLLNGIPSHVLIVIRMLTFFLAGISKNKHNYRLPRFCVFLALLRYVSGNPLQNKHLIDFTDLFGSVELIFRYLIMIILWNVNSTW